MAWPQPLAENWCLTSSHFRPRPRRSRPHTYTVHPEVHPHRNPDPPGSAVLQISEGPGPPLLWCLHPGLQHHHFPKRCLRASFSAWSVRIITSENRLYGKPNVFFFAPCPGEAPILWPPDVKSWLLGKDSDAGKDWGQEEKGAKEDEMVGWHHWLNGHEFEQTLGVSEGQESLACFSPWFPKESDTTEQNNNNNSFHPPLHGRRTRWRRNF